MLTGEVVDLSQFSDARKPLMDWLKSKDNPYFAPAFVNRIWAHYLGIGIVNPPDDFNLGNPPGNRELLTHLSDDFIAHGYDIKRLHRKIMNSRTYQQSWVPNDTNRNDDRLFSKATIRRLPAEAVADAVPDAVAEPEPLKVNFGTNDDNDGNSIFTFGHKHIGGSIGSIVHSMPHGERWASGRPNIDARIAAIIASTALIESKNATERKV